MDRRQQKTRAAIFNALSSLLKEKNYNHISVQNISDRANIGRSTFYAHFETKDDLLTALCHDIFSHVFAKSLDTEHTHDFSENHTNIYALMTHILYHIRDNKDIPDIINCESGELFLKIFKKYFNDFYTAKVFSDIKEKNFTVPYSFIENHISGSFINMIQWWINNGMAETPEELTEYFKAVTEPFLQDL